MLLVDGTVCVACGERRRRPTIGLEREERHMLLRDMAGSTKVRRHASLTTSPGRVAETEPRRVHGEPTAAVRCPVVRMMERRLRLVVVVVVVLLLGSG